MREYSLTAFLLTLVFVNRVHTRNTEHRQSTPVLQKTDWKHEKHDLTGELSGSFNSRFSHVLEEKEHGEQPHSLPHRRIARSMEDILGVCECLGSRSAPPSVCNFNIEDYGPIIIKGKYLNGTSQLHDRHEQDVGLHHRNDTFPTVSWCEGKLPLLLVSSGEQQSLRLSNVPCVVICPGSLGTSLQELVITDVPEVNITSGVLAHRLMDFTLSLNGVTKALIFPKRALTVHTIEVKNFDDVPNNHMENILGDGRSPQIKVIIENTHSVEFKTESVFAPRVWVEVQQTGKLKLETQAVAAILDSVLRVSSTDYLDIRPRAAIVNKLWVTSTSTVRLYEESVMVMGDEGEVILQDVEDVVAPERAIILGDRATLKLSYVSFLTSSNRVLFSRSPLSSVVLRDVKTDSNWTTFCLATEALSLHKVTAFACLRFVRRLEVDMTEGSRVALCAVNSMEEIADFSLCVDPRCSPCADPKSTTVSPIHYSPTTYSPVPDHRPVSTERLATQVPVNETVLNEDAEGNWWKEPIYLGLGVILITLLLVLLLTCCIYRLCRRSREGSYELTHRSNQTGTFQRTIVTADNLRDNQVPGPQVQAPNHHHHHHVNGAARECFVSYHVHTSHDSSDDHQGWECDKPLHGPDTTKSHQQDTCHQHSSIMVSEDNDSLTSSEMTI